jgi:sugar O-acyltransferase (sialic acid O-acetyltransferase NeuD family)
MKKRSLYILGTGGLAREMAQLVNTLDGAIRWDFRGFIAEDDREIGREVGLGRVVGDDGWLSETSGQADIVAGIGHPGARDRAVRRFASDARFTFPNLIHPTAVVDASLVDMGRGVIVTAGCILTVDIEIGDFTHLNWRSTVGPDARVGESVVVNPGAAISGGVRLGDRVLIGAGAVVLEGRKVGVDATVGAGAVVTHDVFEGDTVVGIPARPVSAVSAPGTSRAET